MAPPLPAALLLLLGAAAAIRIDDRFRPSLERARAAVLSEGDVVLRREEAPMNSSRKAVDTFFAFDTGLRMVKRRTVVRSAMDQLRRNFMDGEEGRDRIAWRFFSDDELPDVRYVQQPEAIRMGKGRKEHMMLRRWLFDLQWGKQHYDFRWMVRADDDGVLCPRNFARFTEGLRTLRPVPRKSLRAQRQAVKPWLDSWTEEQLQGMHEDLPRAMLAISAPCSTASQTKTQFLCKPSAEEQYKRQVRMFETATIMGDPDKDFSFTSTWEENFIVVTPEFIDDLVDKVESDKKCEPTESEYIDHFFERLMVDGGCSEKKWPQELTIVNLGRWDAGEKEGGGMSAWGHSLWDSQVNRMTVKYHSLKEFQGACEDYEMIWFHHVSSSDLEDITVPESLEWLTELPEAQTKPEERKKDEEEKEQKD